MNYRPILSWAYAYGSCSLPASIPDQCWGSHSSVQQAATKKANSQKLWVGNSGPVNLLRPLSSLVSWSSSGGSSFRGRTMDALGQGPGWAKHWTRAGQEGVDFRGSCWTLSPLAAQIYLQESLQTYSSWRAGVGLRRPIGDQVADGEANKKEFYLPLLGHLVTSHPQHSVHAPLVV